MRCLKRYIAREIYHQIFNPVPAPTITDLRQKRKQLGFTMKTAAGHLTQWPSALSRLERGLIRNDTLAANYRQRLHEQAAPQSN